MPFGRKTPGVINIINIIIIIIIIISGPIGALQMPNKPTTN